MSRAMYLMYALCIQLGFVLDASVAASQSFYSGKYFIRWQGGLLFLDVTSATGTNGTATQVAPKSSPMGQSWELIRSPEAGYYYIRSELGRYLDVRSGSQAAGATVQLHDFLGGPAQRWRIHEKNGKVSLQSRLGTYLAAGVSANKSAVLTTSAVAATAEWTLHAAEVIPGRYLIKSSDTGRYLDVHGANPSAGSHLQLWQKVSALNQQWQLIPAPSAGYYFIKSGMGRYLDVQWGSRAPDAPVHIWDFLGGDAQQWSVTSDADGRVTLKSKLGTFLGAAPGGAVNGTRVVMTASAERTWQLEPFAAQPALHGWADLHVHPMSHLGFGKKLMHGAPDLGSIIPAGTRDCNGGDFRARSVDEALGHCNSTHGGWGLHDNHCGNYLRASVITGGLDDEFVHKGSNVHPDHHHSGYPDLAFWPHQTSVTHQQMWFDWIRRARDGGLRAMVALAVNSELLARLIAGDGPVDDRASADLQIAELRCFVARHSDFMELAYSAADLRRIAAAGKVAIILGVEVDNIGNFHQGSVTESQVRDELQRLHRAGVRYFFPIHVVDNKFGGAAVYEAMFNYANKYSTGAPFVLSTSPDSTITQRMSGDQLWLGPLLDGLSGIPYPPAFHVFDCPAAVLGCWDQYKFVRGLMYPDPRTASYGNIAGGHENSRGLTSLGEFAVRELMRMGTLIDVDHMSRRSALRTLELAEAAAPGGYPLMIGHNGIRGSSGSERSVHPDFVRRLSRAGGMFGVGTANTTPRDLIGAYNRVYSTTGRSAAALGTDANGMERLPRASPGLVSSTFYAGFEKSRLGRRTWDYTTEGVAHYGLMWDFVRDVERQADGAAVVGHLYESAEQLARTWADAERQATARPTTLPTYVCAPIPR